MPTPAESVYQLSDKERRALLEGPLVNVVLGNVNADDVNAKTIQLPKPLLLQFSGVARGAPNIAEYDKGMAIFIPEEACTFEALKIITSWMQDICKTTYPYWLPLDLGAKKLLEMYRVGVALDIIEVKVQIHERGTEHISEGPIEADDLAIIEKLDVTDWFFQDALQNVLVQKLYRPKIFDKYYKEILTPKFEAELAKAEEATIKADEEYKEGREARKEELRAEVSAGGDNAAEANATLKAEEAEEALEAATEALALTEEA